MRSRRPSRRRPSSSACAARYGIGCPFYALMRSISCYYICFFRREGGTGVNFKVVFIFRNPFYYLLVNGAKTAKTINGESPKMK